MSQVNSKSPYASQATSHSSPSESSTAKKGAAPADEFKHTDAAKTATGAATSDPYAHVDWSRVSYDFSHVDWKAINYSVGTQAQAAHKHATNTSAAAPGATDRTATSTSAATATSGDRSSGAGPGVYLTNSSKDKQTYSFYDNATNGNGTANPTYTNPTSSVTLAPGESKFVPLSANFKGRVQKTDGGAGTNTWAAASTWAEFQLSAQNDGAAHGDISYQAGYDGAATIASTDGSKQLNGTTQDLLSGAPADALALSATGSKAIANNTNAAATAYLQAKVDKSQAYTGMATSGTKDVASKNNQLAITFY